MKRFIAIFVVVGLLAAMAVPALAQFGGPNDGPWFGGGKKKSVEINIDSKNTKADGDEADVDDVYNRNRSKTGKVTAKGNDTYTWTDNQGVKARAGQSGRRWGNKKPTATNTVKNPVNNTGNADGAKSGKADAAQSGATNNVTATSNATARGCCGDDQCADRCAQSGEIRCRKCCKKFEKNVRSKNTMAQSQAEVDDVYNRNRARSGDVTATGNDADTYIYNYDVAARAFGRKASASNTIMNPVTNTGSANNATSGNANANQTNVSNTVNASSTAKAFAN